METPNGLQVPTLTTLRKYGGTEELWFVVAERQGFRCGGCGKLPAPSGRDGKIRLAIDHEHVRGWAKLKPADRWQYVRGLLCWTCNSFRLKRGATVENLRGCADYLERYERRKAGLVDDDDWSIHNAMSPDQHRKMCGCAYKGKTT